MGRLCPLFVNGKINVVDIFTDCDDFMCRSYTLNSLTYTRGNIQVLKKGKKRNFPCVLNCFISVSLIKFYLIYRISYTYYFNNSTLFKKI